MSGGCFLDSHEIMEEFFDLALPIARKLGYTKYHTVSCFQDPEDVVQELATKIIRRGVKFDDSKASLKTFVYVMLNRLYIDLSRKYNGKVCKSLDHEEVSDEGVVTFGNLVPSPFPSPEDIAIGNTTKEYIINNLPCDGGRVAETPLGIKNMSVRNVVIFKSFGYTAKDIASWFGVNSSSVSNLLKKGESMMSCMV